MFWIPTFCAVPLYYGSKNMLSIISFILGRPEDDIEERFFFTLPHFQISFSSLFFQLALSPVFIECQSCARHCIGYMWEHRDKEGLLLTFKELSLLR